jgi:hypothetical protein
MIIGPRQLLDLTTEDSIKGIVQELRSRFLTVKRAF